MLLTSPTWCGQLRDSTGYLGGVPVYNLGMALRSDDIERLTAILVRMHQRGGQAAFLRQASGFSVSHIAKLCGASPESVYAWESGILQPTTGQALAWLHALQHSTPTVAEQLNKATQAVSDSK